MQTAFYGLLVSLLPWAVGVAMMYALLYQPKRWHVGQHLIVIGLGSYIGYVILALTMYQLQARNLPVFSSWILAWALAGVMICWVIGQLGRYRLRLIPTTETDFGREPKLTGPRWLILLLGSWLIAQVGFVVSEVALRPATSWDSLVYWTRFTANFIEWQQSDPTEGSIRLGRRHPSTIHLLNSWAAYAGQINEGKTFLYAPWLALYAGLLLSAIGLTLKLSGNLALGLLVGILIASSPVITAHAALAGYADIWLAAGVFFSAAILALFNVSWKPTIAVIWIFIAISLTFIKSAGISYTVLLSGVALAAWGVSRSRLKWATMAVLVVIIGIGYFYTTGFDTSILGYRLAFNPDSSSIRVGRYRGEISFTELVVAAHNIWFAFIYNTSYFIASLILLAAFLSVALHYGFWHQFNPAYTLILGLALVLYVGLAQEFSGHFLTYSSPDRDTGLTRFSQGWFLVSALLISYIIRAHSNMRNPDQNEN